MALSIVLAENASATGSAKPWSGNGVLTVRAGSWGGGTVKLQYSDGGTWVDFADDATMTVDGGCYFKFADGLIRINIATATGVYATVYAAA